MNLQNHLNDAYRGHFGHGPNMDQAFEQFLRSDPDNLSEAKEKRDSLAGMLESRSNGSQVACVVSYVHLKALDRILAKIEGGKVPSYEFDAK